MSNDGRHTLMINDAEAEDKKGKNGIFSYTHEEQKSHIKSIICHKVVDPRKHVCLGVVCVDSSKKNAFSADRKFYENVLSCFSKRIIYEARFSSMKCALKPVNGGDAQ